MAGAVARGLNVSDLDDMNIGDIVDYCITYNELMSSDKEDKPKTRKATQSDWDSL